MLDCKLLEKGKSDIISISKDSKGGYKGSTISRFDLTSLCEYAFKVAQKAVDEICQGYVGAKPCSDACEWCKFHTICGYQGQSRDLSQEIKF